MTDHQKPTAKKESEFLRASITAFCLLEYFPSVPLHFSIIALKKARVARWMVDLTLRMSE